MPGDQPSNTSARDAGAAVGTQGFGPLASTDPRVSLLADACLPRRSSLTHCQACVDACPVNALDISADGGPSLTGDCTGCGACAVACPSEALAVRGFPAPGEASLTAPAFRAVDCDRVPPELSPQRTLRVPCMAGLQDDELLALTRRAAPDALELLERGWCADCPVAGGHARPIDEARQRAERHLPGGNRPSPRVVRSPLPPAVAEPVRTGTSERHANSRRQFLRRVAGSDDSAPAPPSIANPRALVQPERRWRLLDERQRAGVDAGSLLPAAVISDACCNHRVCAAVCPTGALTVSPGRDGLFFDPADCIQCGFCTAACPEQAIHIESTGGQPGRLTNHRQAQCQDCRRPFTPSGQHDVRCQSCEKSRHLARGAFTQLFRPDPGQ
ncbi:4Fe-4S dicluster domain-containing protein [Aquisalimonas sp.]|uniref:4Fe-4S dicluster domain-containing protein n=1 Tax=Aquisalimonas sp. TaxID=1872621 RepID=UPI0025C6F2CE|nr:4Fe-4S dicluster domain-containing protein [Aquisalimonas sp.]